MTQSPPSSQQLAAHPQCECELSHHDGNAEQLKSFCHGYCYSHELREDKHWPQTFGEGLGKLVIVLLFHLVECSNLCLKQFYMEASI